MPSQIAGSPPEGPPEPTGGTFHRAGPSQPRRRGERRVRSRAPDTLVDAALHAIADAGSIPAVSTPTVRRFGLQRRPGRLSRCAAVHRPLAPATGSGMLAGAPYRLAMATYREHPSRASRVRGGSYVVHPGALDEDTTVWFPLEREDDWEALLGQRIAEDRVRICAVPLFAYDVNLDDEVEVTGRAGAPVAVRVVTDAGNVTFRVRFDATDTTGPDERWRRLVADLEAYECWFDVYSPTFLALSAPPQHAQAVADHLADGEDRGELQYETGRT